MTGIPLDSSALLAALSVIILVMITGLILWQKSVGSQIRLLKDVVRNLEELKTKPDVLESEKDQSLESVRSGDESQDLSSGENKTEGVISHITGQEEPISEAGKEQETEILHLEEEDSTADVLQLECEKDVKDTAGEEYGDVSVNLDVNPRSDVSSIYNVGKSGKSYTEEEVELLIRE